MKRFITMAITASLLQFAASSNTLADTTDKAKLEEVIHQYILKNPEVLVESLQNFQRKQYEQAEKTVKETQNAAPQFAKPLFQQANDPVIGNPNGKITVVEFFDYQCPHCVEMAGTLSATSKANPNVRFVYKEWPIRGPASVYASRAALAANMQGKYDAMHNALLTSNQQPLTQDIILTLAKNAGLDVERLKKDMDSSTVNDSLKATQKLAQDLKLFGTPAFFIGQTDATASSKILYAPGQLTQPQLQEVIDKASK